jgi:hypothetical protein
MNQTFGVIIGLFLLALLIWTPETGRQCCYWLGAATVLFLILYVLP